MSELLNNLRLLGDQVAKMPKSIFILPNLHLPLRLHVLSEDLVVHSSPRLPKFPSLCALRCLQSSGSKGG